MGIWNGFSWRRRQWDWKKEKGTFANLGFLEVKMSLIKRFRDHI
jgi:hypothetical protein